MKFDMIIFDVDGTIWDVSEPLLKALNDVMKEHNVKKVIKMDEVTSALGLNFKDFSDHVLGFIKEENLRVEYLKEAEIKKRNYIEKDEIEPYPHFRNVLKDLSHKYKTGIVSNCGPDTIEQLVCKLDINSYITDFIAASKFKITKAEAIKRIAENNYAEKFIYVGDTHMDKEACEEAGGLFIHAKYGFEKDLIAAYSIEDLSLLPELVEEIEFRKSRGIH